MTIREHLDGDTLTLFLDGDFDETTSPMVEENICRALTTDAGVISLNLKRVDYISSLGIRSLISAYKKAVKTGKKIKIAEMSAKVTGMLDTVGILRLFN